MDCMSVVDSIKDCSRRWATVGRGGVYARRSTSSGGSCRLVWCPRAKCVARTIPFGMEAANVIASALSGTIDVDNAAEQSWDVLVIGAGPAGAVAAPDGSIRFKDSACRSKGVSPQESLRRLPQQSRDRDATANWVVRTVESIARRAVESLSSSGTIKSRHDSSHRGRYGD